MTLPRDIECPWCGAAVNHGCRSRTGSFWHAKTHIARWRAIGIYKPTLDQIVLDGKDGMERDNVIREEVFRRLRKEVGMAG